MDTTFSHQDLRCGDDTRREQLRRDKNRHGIDFLEVATTTGSTNQRVLRVFFIDKADPTSPSTLPATAEPAPRGHRGRARDRRGADPEDSRDGGDEGGRSPARGCERARRLLHVHAAHPELHARPAIRARGLHLQGGLPEPLRLPARPRVSARGGPRAADRLPRQGLRELPPGASGPGALPCPPVDRPPRGGPGRHAPGAARIRGRSAELLPGRRGERGVPRDRPPPVIGPPARPADRLPDARRHERTRLRGDARGGRDPRGSAEGNADPHAHRRPTRRGRAATSTTSSRAAEDAGAREGERGLRDPRGRPTPVGAERDQVAHLGQPRLLHPPRRDDRGPRRRPP